MSRRNKQALPLHEREPGIRKLNDILRDVMCRRGYAQGMWHEECTAAWQEAAGPQFAATTRIGALRGGVLEVFVKNSTVLHELTFQKTQLLGELNRLVPEQRIEGIRFRVGIVA